MKRIALDGCGASDARWRGHDMACADDGLWRYTDTGQLVSAQPRRDCGHCGYGNTSKGHDACIGTLPGVLNACCGHGVDREAYVMLETGERMSGIQALKWAKR